MRLDRRQLLKSLTAAGFLSAFGGASFGSASRGLRNRGLIPAENGLLGTPDWLLTKTRVDPRSRFRCPWIEGYCSRTSLRAGEQLDIMVSTNPPSSFVIDFYRMGYYNGAGGRFLTRLGAFQGKVQPDPPIGPERLRDCQWEPVTSIVIPTDWPSGVYLGKLTAEREGIQSYIVFIVRDDRPCDVLFKSSDTTWAAYNRWPSKFSLYDDGKKPWFWGPGVRVSWNRPYGKYRQLINAPLSQGSGEFLLWEIPLAFWLEKEGYDVSYISGLDSHIDPAGLLRGDLLVSVGHDEYWTREMHDNVIAARDAGVSLAFLSGNACFGMIDLSADERGVPDRSFSRIDQYGPIDPRNLKEFPELAEFHHTAPDESLLIGGRTDFPWTGVGDWICRRPDHWVFAGTGMQNGDFVPGLVGWEWHGAPAPISGLELVASGMVWHGQQSGTYTSTVYPGPKGSFVFNGATVWWSAGLSAPPGYKLPHLNHIGPHGPDPRIQRITANLIARARRQ